MTNFDAIIKLIEVLGEPYSMVLTPIIIGSQTFDGIRICEDNSHDYELFVDVTEKYNTIEPIEEVYMSAFLSERDEDYIKNLLESYL